MLRPVALLVHIASLVLIGGCSESDPPGGPAAQARAQQDEGPPTQPAEESTGVAAPPEPEQPDPERIARGRVLFAVAPGTCIKCHGENASGTARAPDLTDSAFTHSDGSIRGIAQTIAAGVPQERLSADYPFQMNPRGGADLTDEQCLDLAHYIRSLAD